MPPHTISHSISENTTIRTQSLKVVTTNKDSEAVLDGLIGSLTITPKEFQASTMSNFKIILFQNHAIGRLTKLLTRQNDVLHNTVAILVVDRGYYNTKFEGNGVMIVEMAVSAR